MLKWVIQHRNLDIFQEAWLALIQTSYPTLVNVNENLCLNIWFGYVFDTWELISNIYTGLKKNTEMSIHYTNREISVISTLFVGQWKYKLITFQNTLTALNFHCSLYHVLLVSYQIRVSKRHWNFVVSYCGPSNKYTWNTNFPCGLLEIFLINADIKTIG